MAQLSRSQVKLFPAGPHPLVRLQGVSRLYDQGAIIALTKVDLAIAAGECLAILGPSGSGKSSMMNLLCGIDRPTAGQVYWNEQLVRSRKQWAALRGSEIGIVFQEFNLLPTLTAIENVEMALMGRGLPAVERRSRAMKAIARVGLADRIDHLPQAMSGGERQRVAIARSVVNTPKLLLADEPTGSLDSVNATLVIDLLLGLQEDIGMTLVLITHDEELAMRCNRWISIKDGAIVDDRVQAPPIHLETLAAARSE